MKLPHTHERKKCLGKPLMSNGPRVVRFRRIKWNGKVIYLWLCRNSVSRGSCRSKTVFVQAIRETLKPTIKKALWTFSSRRIERPGWWSSDHFREVIRTAFHDRFFGGKKGSFSEAQQQSDMKTVGSYRKLVRSIQTRSEQCWVSRFVSVAVATYK